MKKKDKLAKEKIISKSNNKNKKFDLSKVSSIQLKNETEIATDFAVNAYKKFDKIIKSIILFGSTVKKTAVAGSDIDVIIIVDDVSISWDQELIAWYREELGKIIQENPYRREIHINTIKLSTWWEDLMKGDPVVINVIRYGESLIDFGGFFEPLKFLLMNGKIKSTPESIYNCLNRAPMHFSRSRISELNSVEGLYWAMVDSSHAALIAAGNLPPSPEHISGSLKETFVDKGMLKMKYALWYRDLLALHKRISHGEITNLKGAEIDDWQQRTEEFMKTMADLVKVLVEKK